MNPLLTNSPWRNRLLFFYLAALALWFLLQFCDLADRAFHDRLTIARDNNLTTAADYLQFYTVDKIACSDDRGKLFQWPVQQKWQDEITKGYPPLSLHFFAQNCPLTFLMILPLSFLPMNAGQLTWDILTLLFGALGCAALVKTGSHAKLLPLMFMVGVCASEPSVVMLMSGQLTFFLLGTVSLYFWSLLKRKELLAGVFLAFTAVKYQFIPIYLLALLPARQFKALVSMTVVIALLCILMGCMWGWSNFIEYPKALVFVDGTFACDRAFTCLRGLLAYFGVPTKLNLIVGCAALLPVGLWLAFIGFTRKFSPVDMRLWYAMLVCLNLAFSPHSFGDDNVMHGATAALFGTEYYHGRVRGPRATICVWLLLLAPVCSWFSVFASQSGISEAMIYLPFNLTLAALFYSLIGQDSVADAPVVDSP